MGDSRSYSGNELTTDLDSVDPQLKEAEIVLTPNARLIERQPMELIVDRIWGKEITFSHVPLTRQDIAPKAQ